MGDDKQLPLLALHSDPETEPFIETHVVKPKGFANGFHDDVRVTILALEQEAEGFGSEDDDENTVSECDRARIQKAVELFANIPSLGKQSVIDPFINKTPTITGLYASLKSLLLLPLLVLRLLVVGAIMVLGFVATKAALAGWEVGQEVLPKWRRNLMIVTRFCGRGILFCFG